MQNFSNENLEEIFNNLHTVKSKISNKQTEYEGPNKESYRNLYNYVNLRKLDLTPLQNSLTNVGLSSLGRSQSCILNSLNQNLYVLSKLLGREFDLSQEEKEAIDFDKARSIIMNNNKIFTEHTDTAFKTRVMVTLPSEAKDSPKLIADLIKNGASVFRINTAHDDKDAWNKMASYIKEENEKQNKDAKIYVDLAGPKNRTTQIKKVFIPFKIGSKKAPFEVELVSDKDKAAQTKSAVKDRTGKQSHAVLVVSDDFFQKCKKNSQITVDDIDRKKAQKFPIVQKEERVFIEADKKVIIYEETKLHLELSKEMDTTGLFNFQLLPQEIKLFKGGEIIITDQAILGESDYEFEGKRYSAVTGCSNKEIFQYVKEGDEIFIDDGKIGTTVIGRNSLGLICKVFLAKDNGTVLKEEKGINFPSTDLEISAITQEDEKNFEDIVEFADIIGLSFAQTKEDIKKLQDMLLAKGKTEIGIVPKIETKMALSNLPEILAQLIQWEKFAIMIARGDLAIEVGFDNLPHTQEEIFNICEAAHVPVIYATQILEGKMKNNLPSRAEVTDAGFAQRADCVMLNKGPYVVDTVVTIKNILRNVHKVFQKNRQLLNTYDNWKI